MIEKLYCLKCDTCGAVVNYWCESSAKDAIEKERNTDVGAIALRDGKCFCCAYCRKIWLNIRKNKRIKERNKQNNGEGSEVKNEDNIEI